MNPVLETVLRSGALSSLGCTGESVTDGDVWFDFGDDASLPDFSRCTTQQIDDLVRAIVDWHDDLSDADSDDVREVLRQLMT